MATPIADWWATQATFTIADATSQSTMTAFDPLADGGEGFTFGLAQFDFAAIKLVCEDATATDYALCKDYETGANGQVDTSDYDGWAIVATYSGVATGDQDAQGLVWDDGTEKYGFSYAVDTGAWVAKSCKAANCFTTAIGAADPDATAQAAWSGTCVSASPFKFESLGCLFASAAGLADQTADLFAWGAVTATQATAAYKFDNTAISFWATASTDANVENEFSFAESATALYAGVAAIAAVATLF